MNRPQIKQRGWSIQLLSIAGIPIRLHLSFFLLIAWVILDALGSNEDPIFDTLFVLGIFACILLHELSHALTATVPEGHVFSNRFKVLLFCIPMVYMLSLK